MFNSIIDLLILFSSAFLAATILPAQSEAVLASLHLTGEYSPILLVLIATLGNVLGSILNWLMGRYILFFQDKKWFPVKKESLSKAEKLYKKFGIWTLLFAWVPIIGDPMTVVAGVFRTNILIFIMLVTIGKMGRYIAIVALL